MAFSKREKIMIYGCSLLAVGTLTYLFAIAPLTESIETLTEERDTMQAYLDDVTYNASMADSYEKWLGETKTSYIADRAFFDDVYDTENADRIFTAEVMSHGLSPESFSITEKQYNIELLPYDFAIPEEYSATEGESTLPYSNYIYMRSVSFTCKGTFEKALELVDDLKDRNGVMINSAEFSTEAEKPDYSNGNTTVALSVSFDIYNYDRDGFARDNDLKFE